MKIRRLGETFENATVVNSREELEKIELVKMSMELPGFIRLASRGNDLIGEGNGQWGLIGIMDDELKAFLDLPEVD